MSTTMRKIEDILTQEYSPRNYVDLVKEIFSSVHLINSDTVRKERSNFSSHIEGYAHIGNYFDEDSKKIAMFSVQLKKRDFVERSRSTQRNFVKKLIENGNCDAALAAFYTPGDPKWRLSFVRLDYEMKIERGKLKTSESLTPAKRYSFLVGKDEPCHTVVERFSQFIIDNKIGPSLDELEEAFSVEKVTKEFFELYCGKFNKLCKYLESNDDFVSESTKCGFTSEQFAKKLMGQIVFLYFLQKKGWLGVSVWPKFLSEKDYKNVFYVSGVQGHIIKEHLPRIYVLQSDGQYKFNSKALDEISDDAEEVIANNMKSSATWGEGSKCFLRTLFTYSKNHKGHFYENYLEPLFYNALNHNRGPMGYSTDLHYRVPFLSGGLFDPLEEYDWKSSYFDIPDELFSNKKDENDRNGDGILDIFDRYNFTMSEDEPMEREVAIDPEMLGKVFESLLEPQDRKAKGEYYTPREIVHYMCKESLINYLVRKTGISDSAIRDFILYGDFMKDEDTVKEKREGNGGMFISEEIFKIDSSGTVIINRLNDLDSALATVRVADPAVGSGAFLLGMINEIVKARENITVYSAIKLNNYEKRWLYSNDRSTYKLKYYTIKNSIFAVDIEPSAIDIAQLRLWLSLVIDDEINPNAVDPRDGHKTPLPLPNLECNILCGDSLMDEFKGIKLINESEILNTARGNAQIDFTQNGFDAILEKLLETQDELFRCDDPNKKGQLKENIQSYKDMIIMNQLQGCSEEVISEYKAATEMSSKPFTLWQLDFARVFRDNGGFDIILGNPPYVQLQKSISEGSNTKLGDLYKNLKFKTFTKKGDYYCLFYEKGFDLLCNNGTLAFITSNKWMRAGYGESLRTLFAENTNPLILIDFAGQKIFETATVDVNILMFEKGKNKGKTLSCIAKEGCKNDINGYVKQNSTAIGFSSGDSWTILSPIEESIKKKIEEVGVPLKDWDIKIYRGILTGFNEAFIISGAKKDELIAADPKSAEIIKPILRGRDIKRYGHNFADLWLITTFPSRKYDISDYPAIKEHLLSFGIERLEQTGKTNVVNGNKVKARKKTNNKWFETQDSISYWEEFSKPKIIYPNMTKYLPFYFDNKGYVTNQKCFIITGSFLGYLTAFFNSSLFKFCFRDNFPELLGGTRELSKIFFEKVPVLKVNEEANQKFTSLVLKLEKHKSEGTDTSELEHLIEDSIFKLYNISDEEIQDINRQIQF